MITAATLLALATTSQAATGTAASRDRHLVTVEGAVVTRVSALPAPSGTFRTFVSIGMRFPGGTVHTIHQPYFGETQFVPGVRSICSVSFHYEPFPTAPNGRLDYMRPAMVADSMACDTGRW
jgi:hypothetical protein